MSKYGYLRRSLEKRGLIGPGRFTAPSPASRGQIELAHDPGYVAKVLDGGLSSEEVRRIGLPQTERVVRRSRLSVAGTLLASWMALERGMACNAAGGSHHAGPDYGAGFCVFNDVAFAIQNLKAQGIIGSALIVDADVHQGDGTAKIFQTVQDVFTLSIHSERNFPARKASSSIDVALPDGTEDRAYNQALASALDQALSRVMPSIIFYNAGVDVHRDDKLGHLRLSNAGIRERDARVVNTAADRKIPLVCVLGGGYSDDQDRLAECHAILFEEAARRSE